MRDVAPAIKKLHSSILACIADAATHAATRAEHDAKMEEVASARWASVMKRQDIKLNMIKANIVAKKRKEDLAILLVDTSAWTATSRRGAPRSVPRS
jgi:aspartate/methionine/tyrosine aminotransferase